MKSRATQTKELDMVNGPLARKILIYSIPLMFSNLLQVFFNMTDVAVVGKFAGARALGSVGSTTIIITLTTGILLGMRRCQCCHGTAHGSRGLSEGA